MNITTVRFLNTTVTTSQSLYQWDYGQELKIEGLELPATFEVHFCNENSTTTTTQIGTDNQVTIPDTYLTTGKGILAYIYLHTGESDGETEYKIKIPVRARQQPSDTPPTPEQQSAITEAIAALNAGVEAAGDSAEDAEAWAVGQRGGVDVPDTDPTWHNNAKYYAEHGGGGGGGGTTDYTDLSNKPQINNVTLNGNKSASDLGLVAAETGKGLSTNDYTDAEKTKLSGIAAGAEVNVQSDWNQSDSSAGDYIKNKPTIPAAVTVDSALSDSSENPVQNKVIKAALDGKGTYSKPSGGIPASDMESAVQTSLGKADTALQSVPNTYRTASDQDVIDGGKQAKITASGILKGDGSGGVSAAVAGTDYQAPLVAGTDYATPAQIPTVPSDIGAAPAITEVTVSDAGSVTQALDPGKLYHFTGTLTALTVTLTAASAGQIAQYHFDFDCGSTAPTVTIPNTVTMPDSQQFEASKHYEVDILNNYGVVSAWATS